MTIVIGIILVPFLYAILQKALPNTPIMKKIHSYVHMLMITSVLIIGVAGFSNRPQNLSELINIQAAEFQTIQTDSTNFVSQNLDVLVRNKVAEIAPDVVILRTDINITALRDNIIIHTAGGIENDDKQEIVEELADIFKIGKDAIKIY